MTRTTSGYSENNKQVPDYSPRRLNQSSEALGERRATVSVFTARSSELLAGNQASGRRVATRHASRRDTRARNSYSKITVNYG